MNQFITIARRAAALSIVTALAACSGGGGGGSHVVPASNSSNGSKSSTSSLLTNTLEPSATFSANAKVGTLATSVPALAMHVMVNLQNGAGLIAYAKAVSQPGNAMYRHYLTASQIGAQYGASATDTATVANYFASYGLKVGGWPQRLGLVVSGPRTAFEQALGTTFSYYKDSQGHVMVAPTSKIVFSKSLPVKEIADAIVEPSARHLQSVRGTPNGNLGLGNSPQIMAAAFDYNGAYNAGYTGKGITIGIIGTGPISSADFPAYRASFGLAGSSTVNLAPVTATAAANAGGSPTATPPPVTPPCNGPASNNEYSPSESPTSTCNPEDGETQIDTEQSAGLARDATVNYYLAYVPVECDTPGSAACAPDPTTGLGYAYQGLAEADDEIQQAIADNDGGGVTAGPDILSLSYGGPELFNSYTVNGLGTFDPTGFEPSEFAALAAEGVAVFVSSGDQGAETCAPYTTGSLESAPCVSYPSGDQNVTSVGGVTAPLNNAGQFLGPITGWGEQTFSSGQGGASGGGVSTIIPAPVWQTGVGISASGRNQPDASLDGDPNTGVAVLEYASLGGEVADYGGTSVAAPEMAAMWALVLQACAQSSTCGTAQGGKAYRLGNAAPYFYQIYNASGGTAYASTFYDVVFGNNGITPCYQNGSCPTSGPAPTPAPGYSAGTGYDLVTGLGVPFALHLTQAILATH